MTVGAPPIQYVKGVGPHRAELLSKLGISSPSDLLFYFPRSHQDRRIIPLSQIEVGKKTSVRVLVQSATYRQAGPQLGQFRAMVQEGERFIEAVWFRHLSYKFDVFAGIRKHIQPGKWVCLFGLIDIGKKGLELKVEEYEPVENGQTTPSDWNSILPVYPALKGVGDKWLRQLMARLIEEEAEKVGEYLPRGIIESEKLMPIAQALTSFHFPKTWADRDKARERLAFDEFFFLELALEVSRRDRSQHAKGFSSVPTKTLLTPFKHRLGFAFTKSQTRMINQIFHDMAQPAPMYRLLQGDVGSGKTCVALSAALLSIENGRQAALLAPTEILAEQHCLSLDRFLEDLPVKVALLTRSTPPPERKKIIEKLKKGKIDLLVGTHAILNEEVEFHQLGLVIVDEQHRFGVRQRAKIISKATQSQSFQEGRLLEKTHPDVLVMTATPIPRTLALTLYGDLDVSVMDELPSGRSPIVTRMVDEAVAIGELKKTVQGGHQAYVVLPLIEESERLSKRMGIEVRSAKKEFEKLQTLLPALSLGLLHGQMKSDEKKSVMEAFRKGKVSILVATPVIEVGIDVPRATTMVIMNPERFGLSQLHQLRGRVGRGQWPSQFLIVRSQREWEQNSNQRLESFCNISDGFRLAEEDLKMRGPGEILGEAQSGVPFFKVGDLVNDGLLISRSRNAAKLLVHGDLQLSMNEFSSINHVLQKRFGDKIHLSYVG